MLNKTLALAAFAVVAGFTAAQAHGTSNDNRNENRNSNALVSVNANVGSQRGGLLDLNTIVAPSSHGSSLLGLNVDVGGRNGLVNARANVGGQDRSCDFCGNEGGVGHARW